MAALTHDIDTPKSYGERFIPGPAKANAIAFVGGLLAREAATGLYVPASDTVGLKVEGRCTVGGDNTGGANGDKRFTAEAGVFSYTPSAALLAAGNAALGDDVFVVDDQTVGLAADTVNSIKAGVLEYIDAEGLYFVRVNC